MTLEKPLSQSAAYIAFCIYHFAQFIYAYTYIHMIYIVI